PSMSVFCVHVARRAPPSAPTRRSSDLLRAGLAEVVKYGAIVDAPFLDWLETHAAALLAGDDDALAEAIARSCEHKAALVERDPLDRKSTRLNSSHVKISYAVLFLKKNK